MADAQYDAIVIGGGNKGLVTAMYLTKFGGMKTAIFETRHEVGGGWSSEESAAPGFVSNIHSTAHCTYYHDLMWKDFPDFEEKGGSLMLPKCSVGMAFKEDDSALVFHNAKYDPTWEKQAAALARFSQRDADTLMGFAKVWDEWLYPEFHRWIWTPATANQPDAFFQKIRQEGARHGIDPNWVDKSLMQVCDELFESPEIKCSLLRGSYSWWGAPGHIQGTGMSVLAIIMASARATGFIRGGTHSLAHAAQKIVVENGGKLFTAKGVVKILVEGGKATGVRLADGSEVKARIVVSSVSPQDLCLKLLDDGLLSPAIIAKIKALYVYASPCLWWCHWAVHEPPKYKSAAFDPDIEECAFVGLGDKDPWSPSREYWRRKLGKEYPGAPLVDGEPLTWSYGVIGDPTYAPKGKCSLGNELYTCEVGDFTEKEWAKAEVKAAEFIMNKWGEFASNMTWDNVIGYNIDSPWDITYRLPQVPTRGTWNIVDCMLSQIGWNRPIPEISDHRMPIKGLYGTGSGWHPLGFGMSTAGYNCYKVISDDYSLRQPWKEAGREY